MNTAAINLDGAANEERTAMLELQRKMLQSVLPSGQTAFFTAFDAVAQFCAGACGKGVSHLGVIEANAPTEVLGGRMNLIEEEVNKELMPLLQKIITNGGSSLEQKAEMLDHICDSIYVLVGLAVNMGLPIDNAFAIVHAANMSKVVGSLVPDGPTFNDYGKVMKPEGWTAPDKQIWELCFWLYSQRVKQPTNGPEETAGQEPAAVVFGSEAITVPAPVVPENPPAA